MGQIAVAVKHLIAAGITGDALVRAIEDMEASTLPPPKKKRDPNSPGAIRNRRYRGTGEFAENVTDVTDVAVTDVTSQGVTEASQGVTVKDDLALSPHTPLSEYINKSTTRDARATAPSEFENECRKWANGSLVEGFDGAGFSTIERLLSPPSGGEPCTRDDVRNGISDSAASLHAKGRRNDIATLAYFEEPILRARDKRLTPLRKVEIIDERAGSSQGGNRSSHAGRRYGAGSGNQHRGNGFIAGLALLESVAEAQNAVSDGPEDWRDDRVAASG